MNVKEHYDKHLGNFYSWMAGDFEARQQEQLLFFKQQGLLPASSKIAIDLGAGHGIQAVALAKLGFKVKAIDFNKQLLAELATNRGDLAVDVIEGDFREIKQYADAKPELIVCCGDTLTHLSSKTEVKQLLKDCAEILLPEGKLLLSFRDYSQALSGDTRFIPVKSDDTRILTCFLEFSGEQVQVTDLLYEKTAQGWQQKVSSYNKIRISPDEIAEWLQPLGMTIRYNEPVNRLITLIAVKEKQVA